MKDFCSESLSLELSDQATKVSHFEAKYCAYQTAAIEQIFQNHTYDHNNQTTPGVNTHDICNTAPIVLDFDADLALEKFKSLQMANLHDEDALVPPQTLQLTNTRVRAPGSIEEYLNSRCLSVDQTKAITETGIVDIFNKTAPQQLCLF